MVICICWGYNIPSMKLSVNMGLEIGLNIALKIKKQTLHT